MMSSIPTTEKKPRNRPSGRIQRRRPPSGKWTEDKKNIFIKTIKMKGVCEKGHYKGSYNELARVTGFTVQQCRNFWSDAKKMKSNSKIKLWKKIYRSASNSNTKQRFVFEFVLFILLLCIVMYR
jgi:hypothetical protein